LNAPVARRRASFAIGFKVFNKVSGAELYAIAP
jgi:hypothetical protein